MEDFSVITQLVGSLGFPICVAGFFIIKSNKTQEENNKLLAELTLLIKELINYRKDDK